MSKPKKDTDIVSNPKARRDYAIGDTYECGLVLTGTEVKSVRAGKAQISEAFARVEKGEVCCLAERAIKKKTNYCELYAHV